MVKCACTGSEPVTLRAKLAWPLASGAWSTCSLETIILLESTRLLLLLKATLSCSSSCVLLPSGWLRVVSSWGMLEGAIGSEATSWGCRESAHSIAALTTTVAASTAAATSATTEAATASSTATSTTTSVLIAEAGVVLRLGWRLTRLNLAGSRTSKCLIHDYLFN